MDINQHTKDLGNGITQIDSGYMQGDIAAIYLLEQNGQCAIIETGTAHSVPFVLQVIESRGMSADDVAYIIPTHVHLDHAGGAGELMHLCKNAQLIIHPFGARHMIDPAKLEAGVKAVYGEAQFDQLYGSLKPVDAHRLIEAPDGYIVDFNGRQLEFLDTPGHARHHFCVLDKQSQGIFTGDTFGLAYPQLETPSGPFIFATTTPVQFDPEALHQSIHRLALLKAKHMYLTHFGAIVPKPDVVQQLDDSVAAFTQIALQEIDKPEDRVNTIKNKIMSYLLDKLEKLGCEQSRDFCKTIIEADALLNAQGLDFWLSHKAPHSQARH